MKTFYLRLSSLALQLQQLLQLFSEAIAGKEQDYTAGSIRRAVILLAVPMVLEMAMESVFAIVDIFFVSRWADQSAMVAVADAVAAVGLTEAVLTLVYATAFGVAMGVTAVVSRRVGEKNLDAASVAAAQVLWIGLGIAVLVAGVGLFFAEPILRLMGASEVVVAEGRYYTAIMLSGSLSIAYLFLINAVFRGAGNASLAMRGLWLANGINLLLDPCLIFGWGPLPELGVTGAAVATTIGRSIGVVFLLWHLFGGSQKVHLVRRHLRIVPAVMFGILRVSLGGVLQFLIATASWVFLMRIMSGYGSSAIAGYTIAIRVIVFTFLPAWGLSNAAATLVGQNLGANNPQRAEQSVWQTVKYNVVFMVTVALVLLSFGDAIIAFFTDDAAVVTYGRDCLRIVSYCYGFFAVGLVLTQAFNGSGDTVTPTWINFICFWLVQIPLAYTVANWIGWGPTGVFASISSAESLVALLAFWQFRKERWKLQQT